eukprot:g4372.t1
MSHMLQSSLNLASSPVVKRGRSEPTAYVYVASSFLASIRVTYARRWWGPVRERSRARPRRKKGLLLDMARRATLSLPTQRNDEPSLFLDWTRAAPKQTS